MTDRLLRHLLTSLFISISLLACNKSSNEQGVAVQLESGGPKARVRYLDAAPEHVYDSALVRFEIQPDSTVRAESLSFELLPAENGWCRAQTPFLHKNAEGWFEGAFWMRPTIPGQFVLSWQTIPFTGYTFYFAARYDSLGNRIDWNDIPIVDYPAGPVLVRDTMEVAYRSWPQVWTRRVHFVRRTDAPKEFYVITETYQRTRGVSGRRLEYSANLIVQPEYPLITQRWEEPGWVVDTLSIWVRDTLVSWMAWNYEEFVDNWERNTTLFRSWQFKRSPELYFKVDVLSHLTHVWFTQPAGEYIAAKMYADTSKPSFDSLKKEFMYAPSPTVP